jgi:predicted RNA binding protein YcfA (HicA-like mRNA interferase family)
MPKLRRLSGLDLVRILRKLGFEVVRIKGSHHIMRRVINIAGREETQTVNVPVHGSQPVPAGTLKQIYRDLLRYFSDEVLRIYFYSE